MTTKYKENYNPLFSDNTHVDIWNSKTHCWEYGGIIWQTTLLHDGITIEYFVVPNDKWTYNNSKPNDDVKWVEQKHIREAHNPKTD